jgi:hypothetical protein
MQAVLNLVLGVCSVAIWSYLTRERLTVCRDDGLTLNYDKEPSYLSSEIARIYSHHIHCSKGTHNTHNTHRTIFLQLNMYMYIY